MSTVELDARTAVLPRSGLRRRWTALLTEPALERSLPSTVLFALAAVLVAGGVLPVVDGELVLAGLTAAFVAPLVGRLAAPAGADAVVVPLVHVGAVALLWAGITWPGVFLLAVLPVVTLVVAPARRIAGQATRIEHLEGERALLLAQVQTRADELDVATRMLAARAQTMTSVIDAVTEQSIIGTDRDGVIRVWNPGAEKMLGLQRPDVVRKRSIVEFHLPEELEAAAEGHATGLEALVHAASEHGSDVRDWTYVAADGERRTVCVAVTPRTDDRGVHAGWNFVGTDMTEVRAAERMKDQFVSLISHELRTPLTSILGYLELVLEDDEQPLTDEQRQYLTTVERNADRLLRLVGDLLFTAQVDAGRFTLQPHPVDLATVVRAAEESVRVTAAGTGVEIVVDVPENGLVVDGDAVRLGQAVDNLVSNAVKFTPSGGRVTLSLREAWQTPDGEICAAERPDAVPMAQLAVSDTGMGIPTGEQGKLFTRFFRASTAQKNAVPGVGLGLAITKAITTAHGGVLDLVSVEGEGTTFTLTLPRTAA